MLSPAASRGGSMLDGTPVQAVAVAEAVPMTPARRRAAILDLVLQRGAVSVDDLAARFSTSSETVRRDLNHLADSGHLRKVHGGAKRLMSEGEGGFDERMARNTHAKRVAAEKVRALVQPRQTLFMDTGSTTLMCAEALASVRHLTVITNSVAIADIFARESSNTSVFLLGGEYRQGNAQTVGPATVQEIAQYQADHAILTVGGVDTRGIWDYSHDEAQVARAMLGASQKLTVVTDHSKFNCKAAFRVCELSRIDELVSDSPPTGALASAMTTAKVNLR